MAAHLAIHEDGGSEGTPWPTEIYFVNTFVCSEFALVEHVTILLTCWRGGCCDVAIGFAMNLAILKPGSRWSEDEVGCSLYVTIIECDTRSCHSGVNGILVAQEPAILYQNMVALGM